MSISRVLQKTLVRSKKSILLLGPRQTGKSTLIHSLKPDLEINLADEETFTQFLRDPGFIKKVITQKHRRVFIDEIQRIPSLLNTIQTLLDHDKTLQFYLTGSSARKLKRGKANLLPGRIHTYHLGPLCAEELGYSLDIDQILRKGLLPGIYTESDEFTWKKTLRSYSATYLKEEIQAEALTRNLEGFSRYFDVVTSHAGHFIDFSKFSSLAQIERMSAVRYFEVLVDTLIVHPVEAFAKSKKRRLVQHPKYFFFDVGVLNGCLRNFEASNDRIGSLFEHLILQLILSGAAALDQEVRVTTYRTEAGAEVDFIIEKEGVTFALEVKSTKNIRPHDLRGLKSFAEFYGKKHIPLVVYRGDSEMQIDSTRIQPVAQALKTMGL